MTKDEFKQIILERLPESDCEIKTFTASRQPCVIICNNCKRELSKTRADSFLQRARSGFKNVCNFCDSSSERNVKRNILINKIQTSNPLIKCLDFNFKNIKQPVNFYCSKCNIVFSKSPSAYLDTPKCPNCEQQRVYKLNIDIIKRRCKEIWGNEYTVLSDDYRGNRHSNNKIMVKHNKCGFCWSIEVFNFLQKKKGCPRCDASKPEKEIRKWLEENNYNFDEQKVISYAGHNFRFDFYIHINNNIIKIIEYNGPQHYYAIDKYGGEEELKKQQLYDSLKAEYCERNNIELIILSGDVSSLLTYELAQRLNSQVT